MSTWLIHQLPECKCHWVFDLPQVDGWRRRSDRRVHPSGVDSFKNKWIKVLEIHSGSTELHFQALRSDFCHAAIQSEGGCEEVDTEKETKGHSNVLRPVLAAAVWSEAGYRRTEGRRRRAQTSLFSLTSRPRVECLPQSPQRCSRRQRDKRKQKDQWNVMMHHSYWCSVHFMHSPGTVPQARTQQFKWKWLNKETEQRLKGNGGNWGITVSFRLLDWMKPGVDSSKCNHNSLSS